MRPLTLALAIAALMALFSPASALADVDPAGCTDDIRYDPSIPKYQDVLGKPLGDGPTGSSGRDMTAEIYQYFDAVLAASASNPRVRMLVKPYGQSVLGRPLKFYVLGTPDNIANLDAGRADGPFWAGVRDGSVSEAAGLAAARTRPAFGWITSTPHGAEPAAGEAIARNLYELAARTDCWNARRLQAMDFFLLPVRNPDGRDAISRTSAWTFDHNRDFGTQNQIENGAFLPLLKPYPGVFFIDAHQTSNGYFFPPNEDPVHHEISDFTVDFINDLIGPAIRQSFDDQSIDYFNYNTYDLFVPEYGDTVPSLLSGAAGMTFEKGTSELYAKQVYEHYLAIDSTVDVTVRNKVSVLEDWVEQWADAVRQGTACELEPNEFVSPLTEPLKQQPAYDVCGYFFRPDRHEGDTAALLRHMRNQGVHVFRLESDVNAAGVRVFGTGTSGTATLPKGTLYIPLAQPLKHWIQAVMGEDPFEPVEFFYDVATWSYPLHRGLAGAGFLTSQLPPGVVMTEIEDPGLGTVAGGDEPILAFETDSMQGLALAYELLRAGVRVDRAVEGFTAGGRTFTSGTALVDASTLGGTDMAALAAKRETPVTGLGGYPVEHHEMASPKIGVYYGGTAEPNWPRNRIEGVTGVLPGHCAQQPTGQPSAANFCVAMFTLTEKDDLPPAMFSTITATELAGGTLASGGYTALLNPNGNIAAGPGATALQSFVNDGGIYVGTLFGGLAAARNAGLTTLDAIDYTDLPGTTTPGSTFSGDFDVSNPVAWGFDDGGFIYRENDPEFSPVFDPATLDEPATAPVRFSDPLEDFGFSAGAVGTLDGGPDVVDQPFGEGHAILIAHDAFFRAWKESDERIVLNSLIYPLTEALPAGAVSRRTQPRKVDTVGTAVRDSRLPAVRQRSPKVRRTAGAVRIKVARKNAAKLKRAVRRAKLPKAIRKRAKYVKSRRTVTLVVRGVRKADNDHERSVWVRRIMGRLDRAGVKVIYARL